ncbi:MAG: hypothetical protein LBM64_09010, partial [Deltaproteobacteria bacterium]|nr:hypothetical protein [Deltaproteobacteria bacterium]
MRISEHLAFVLEEVFHGHETDATFIDDGSPGLIDLLKNFSAEEASLPAPSGNIAAHVKHVAFSIGAYQRAVNNEDPSALYVDWPDWENARVTRREWAELISGLRVQTNTLLAAVRAREEYSPEQLRFVFAALAHMSFHFGALQVKYE